MGQNFEALIQPAGKTPLERAMVKFLDDYEVLNKDTNEKDRPKAKTMNYILSQLKNALSEITGHNFGDKVAFRGLSNATLAIGKEIKQAGR